MNRVKSFMDNSLLVEVLDFIASGCEGDVPEEVVEYHDALYKIHGIANREGEATARKYARKTWNVSYYRSKALVLESDELFYTDADVNKKVARNKIIDKLKRLEEFNTRIARTSKEVDVSKNILIQIANLMGLNEPDVPELPIELFQEKIVVLTNNAEMIGLPPMDVNELARIIDDMAVPEKEKKRLNQEAGITDINIEELLDGIAEKTEDR